MGMAKILGLQGVSAGLVRCVLTTRAFLTQMSACEPTTDPQGNEKQPRTAVLKLMYRKAIASFRA